MTVAAFDPTKATADFKHHIFLKIFTTIWFMSILALCAYALMATRNEWWPYEELNIANPGTQKQEIYVFLAGVIGSVLYAFHGFCVAAGPQVADNPKYHYDPNWTWWYIAWPPIGGFVGLFAYAVVKTGTGTLGTTTTDTTSNLGFFTIAALAGLSSRDALGWLGSKSKGMFPLGTKDQGEK